jgi:DNA-binding CsgD family transcriptional regulator
MAPVLGQSSDRRITEALARAIAGIGSDSHVECMVDLIRELVPQDLVTVTRYSTTQRPEFVSHRNFSDAMVKRYLEIYYLHDPFFDFWRRHRRPGVVPLKSFAGRDVKRGRYVAEFLAQSVICDEVGVLLDDGPGWCLGIFLDRSRRAFSSAEIARLEGQFPVFAALHALDTKSRRPGFMRTDQLPAMAGKVDDSLSERLWPELSSRERQLAGLIVAGYPTALIAKRLGISVGTVKNHRRSIYGKLDITTERELFLRYFTGVSSE